MHSSIRYDIGSGSLCKSADRARPIPVFVLKQERLRSSLHNIAAKPADYGKLAEAALCKFGKFGRPLLGINKKTGARLRAP